MTGKPAIEAFFDEPTFTVTYLVSDPATGRAAIVDPVRDYDHKSGKASTASADRGLIVAETRFVASGFNSFSRASPGVSVSGGYTHDTTMPYGFSSGRSVSARPRTAYFAGAYALYPYTPTSATTDATNTRCPVRRSIIDAGQETSAPDFGRPHAVDPAVTGPDVNVEPLAPVREHGGGDDA